MQRVIGLGGPFIKSADPKALAAWYEKHLGIPFNGTTYTGWSFANEDGSPRKGSNVLSFFKQDDAYFNPSEKSVMLNFIVADLMALLETLQARPEINTATLLELFAEHEDAGALQKLATTDMPGDEALWRQEFLDAIAQLQKQARQQRTAELRQRMASSGLNTEETEELRQLLKPHNP